MIFEKEHFEVLMTKCLISFNLDQDACTSETHDCPQCFKSYNYRRNLLRHQKYECGVAAKETCDYCSYVTRYKHSLKSHLQSQHYEKLAKVIE
ncbi:CLUMA_CG002784, isoform A [Clunio marinus]|uniref:CLUMA_CG002784, isoform A n=1 Tax=Clunio marinus TaxID=568069 RepID=A0A1J1HLZ9_9DIPT|nr:CLUMA_CG002784, isoform A [Clunio marinus]